MARDVWGGRPVRGGGRHRRQWQRRRRSNAVGWRGGGCIIGSCGARGARHAGGDRGKRGPLNCRLEVKRILCTMYVSADTAGPPPHLKKWTNFPWSAFGSPPPATAVAAPLPLLEAVAPPSRATAGASTLPPVSHAPTSDTLVLLPSLRSGSTAASAPVAPLLLGCGAAAAATRPRARRGAAPPNRTAWFTCGVCNLMRPRPVPASGLLRTAVMVHVFWSPPRNVGRPLAPTSEQNNGYSLEAAIK
jgi:hypothetical protein